MIILLVEEQELRALYIVVDVAVLIGEVMLCSGHCTIYEALDLRRLF